MTPAIKLAKECCITSTYGGDDVETKCIETFYARAQAQAMREAAKKFRGDIGYNFVAADGYSSAHDIATELDFMADELESK